jgi:hypothetical protein
VTAHPPERVAEAVERACRETRLDLRYVSSVYAYLEEPEDDWPPCCGSDCDPCVQHLAECARRALGLLDAPQDG